MQAIEKPVLQDGVYQEFEVPKNIPRKNTEDDDDVDGDRGSDSSFFTSSLNVIRSRC